MTIGDSEGCHTVGYFSKVGSLYLLYVPLQLTALLYYRLNQVVCIFRKWHYIFCSWQFWSVIQCYYY
jgi:hypothetical protein